MLSPSLYRREKLSLFPLLIVMKSRNTRILLIAGGVAANSVIRRDILAAAEKLGVQVYLPPLSLCGDNGAMIGAQAYSLVVARVSDASKLEEIKKAMFEGIDTRKWICVEADQLRVVSCKDLIMLVMVSSEFAPGVADGMVKAFAEVISGGEVDDVNNVLSGEELVKG